MNRPTSPNSLTAIAAANTCANEKHGPHLAAAKAAVAKALANLGVDRIEAAITNAPAAPCVGAITAFTKTNDIRDLSDTKPVTFAWRDDQRSYANLPAFVIDYLLAQLAHDADPFLIDGQLAMETHYGASSPPIDWAAKFAADDKRRLALLLETKADFMGTCNAHGIATVEAEYDGAGDEGQVEEITAHKADGTPVDLEKIGLFSIGEDQDLVTYNNLNEFADSFVCDVLEHHHNGYEINDGGFGKVVIDVAENKVRLEHNARFTDSELTESEI